MDEYSKMKETFIKKSKLKVSNRSKCNKLSDIQNSDDLDNMITSLFNDLNTDYKIKEIYNYTMALPKEYWDSGSYDKWIRVCWALKNTHEKHILTWIKFCSQIDYFDFSNNDRLNLWDDSDMNDNHGYTYKSIIYWCKTSNPTEYKNIYNKTVDYYIYYSLEIIQNVIWQLRSKKCTRLNLFVLALETILGMNSDIIVGKLMTVAVLFA